VQSSSPDVGIALIDSLEAEGVLTPCQARLLREAWPNFDEDLAASPYLGTVREHTRAYLGIPQRGVPNRPEPQHHEGI
jgi:hypothetical protein